MRRDFTIRAATCCLLVGCLFLFRCSRSSNPSGAGSSISGTVTLEQSADHQGITVRIYGPPEVDADLVQQQSQYSGVGLPIGPRTLFDHRQTSFTAGTETGSDGSYTLSDIPEGDYIVVAERDGYGYQARYDISVREGRNTAIDPVELLLEQELAGTVAAGTTLDGGRPYLVTSDVTVPAGITLTIEPGAQIRFQGYHTLLIEGRLEAVGTEEEMIVFTSDQQAPAKDDWKRIEFSSSDETSRMQWCRVEYSTFGIYGKSTPLLLSHNVIRSNTENGLLIFSTFDLAVEVRNHLVIDSNKGLWLEYADNSVVENCILFDNEELGIGCQECSPVLENNLLQANTYGLYLVYNSNPRCRNNVMAGNEWGMVCGGFSSPLLTLCSFAGHSSGAVYIFQPPRGSQAQPTVNFSNFDESYGLIRIDGGPQAPNNLPIDATHNYWGGLSTEEIDRLIWDQQDVQPDIAPYVALVAYLPLETTLIDSAGLR
jgi:parallel beta-helix repeat protein